MGNKSRFACRSAVALALFSMVVTGSVIGDEPDPRPTSINGTVSTGGGSVPAGTEVQASIGGTPFAVTTVEAAGGASRFRLDLPADLPTTAAREGGVDGDTIDFAVAGIDVPETVTWADGAHVLVDLSAAAGPDISVTIDDGAPSVAGGDAFSYSVTVNHAGGADATGVVLTASLPAYTSLVSASDGGVAAAGVVSWPAFDLNVGASTVRMMTVMLAPAAPLALAQVTSTATVGFDAALGFDPTPTNNTAIDTNSVATPVGALPNLAVAFDSVVVTPSDPTAGDATEVAVVVRNAGAGPAASVPVTVHTGDPDLGAPVLATVVIDDLPAGGNQRLSMPWAAQEGITTLVAVVDGDNVILEIAEDDNRAVREVAVPRLTGPDLVVTVVDDGGLTQSATTLVVQGSVVIEARNQGDSVAVAPFDLQLFEDSDGDGRLDAGEAVFATTTLTTPLAAGASEAVTMFVSTTTAFLHPLVWAAIDAND